VTLRIKDWRFFRRALSGGDIGVGESYMAGEWDCSDLVGLCRLSLLQQEVMGYDSPWGWVGRLAQRAQRRLSANTLSGSRRNIQYHYDLSNDLYRLFLDESLTYSCGVFTAPSSTLEEAQIEKIDGACRRLALQPHHHLLEIGSGWGSFALHAAKRYGCRITSITLSEQQLALARRRVEEAGLGGQVEIRLQDYRQVRGSFDRIVSIEMLEAVGYEYFPTFFAACDRLLKPGGRLFLQTITVPDQRFEAYRRQFDWIRKYIFPGGCLASIHAIATAIRTHTQFQIQWLRDIGPHYARTLRGWRERFTGNLPEVRRLGFDERFIRMWDFYLASCEAGFDVGYIGDAQMLLARTFPPR